MLLSLFLTFCKIGLFSFGGGYAVLAMIQQEVVNINAWMTASEFADIVAISQMTPGPIAINAATFVGYRQGGIPGSLVCTLGVIFPSIVLMLAITFTYIKLTKLPWFQNIFQKLRWVTLGLIAAAMLLIGKTAFTDLFSVIIFVAALFVTWRWKTNPIYLMLGAAVIGLIFG
ncbi:MAG: chromate transporter [Candidatus Cloacimonadaceae bacterium]|jgi:chromate transporter|nr:chromate transporter [Candidatus Cloacimonadota bacterium]MDD5624879.1 chromate transporter [Candidatus Cloacimonadota bacterium]MDY0111712.1 chromate transporter [Candidatus Syntrophosphaera sp.]